MNLAAILDPYTEETFFSTFWERRPLHIARARPGYFRELLTLEGMNEVLSQLVFRADECKVAREGQIIPPSVYLAAPSMRIMERTATDYVSSVRLLALFTQGATLVFSQLNHKWQPLERLRRELQRQLSAAVVTNVFLSNRDSQGFSVHYDSHDVLVLQLHGRKI